MNRQDPHPDWNELAALVDHGSSKARPELLAHLAACPACLAAWSAAVEARDRELAAVGVGAVSWRPRRRPRELAWGVGGLAAAALLLVLLLPRGGVDPAEGEHDARIQQRLAGLSHVGLVLPRVPVLGATPITDYRAGLTNGAVYELGPWAERFAADTGDTEAAFWLAAGHLGRGQLDLAEDVLRRALRRAPGARDLRHLAAVAAYQRSDLVAAEQTLRVLLADDPGDRLAQLNLAIIGLETGEVEPHRAALRALAADPRQPALQVRARQLLDSLLEP